MFLLYYVKVSAFKSLFYNCLSKFLTFKPKKEQLLVTLQSKSGPNIQFPAWNGAISILNWNTQYYVQNQFKIETCIQTFIYSGIKNVLSPRNISFFKVIWTFLVVLAAFWICFITFFKLLRVYMVFGLPTFSRHESGPRPCSTLLMGSAIGPKEALN